MSTKPHGTDARYRQHRLAGEPACDPCRIAGTARSKAQREAEFDEDRIALAGGEWRPDKRGIQRWHPATTVLQRVESADDEATRIRRAIAERAA